jgi:hypothetical protein
MVFGLNFLYKLEFNKKTTKCYIYNIAALKKVALPHKIFSDH